MKRFLFSILAAVLLLSLTACRQEKSAALQTADMKEMIVGAELPYLLYANKDYCILNMWQGGVVVYEFSTQNMIDRITFEQLEEVGFLYPRPTITKDGKTICFQEDALTGRDPNTHSYELEGKKLVKENDTIETVIQYKALFENNETQALLSDGYAYGTTFIEFDDSFVVSRLKTGGSLLSDTEIVFMNKSLKPEKVFSLFDE